jgi:hypothetical protein
LTKICVRRSIPGVPCFSAGPTTVSVVAKALKSQVSEGEQMIVMLDKHITE